MGNEQIKKTKKHIDFFSKKKKNSYIKNNNFKIIKGNFYIKILYLDYGHSFGLLNLYRINTCLYTTLFIINLTLLYIIECVHCLALYCMCFCFNLKKTLI